MLSLIGISREDPDPHSQVFRSTNPDESEFPQKMRHLAWGFEALGQRGDKALFKAGQVDA